MPEATDNTANLIIGRSLVTSETVASELRERLSEVLADGLTIYSEAELIDIARGILEEFEPLLAESLHASQIAAWIAGYDDTSKRFPKWLLDEFGSRIPPAPPGKISLPLFNGGEGDEIRFPIIERAAESLIKRGILTRPDFDRLSNQAKAETFTIAAGLKEDTIETIRDILVEDIDEGPSFTGFKERIKEEFETSPIGPAHLENVYRTNIQAAFRDGRESLADNPIVSEVFPYQQFIAIHDARTRTDHLAMETLGLDGTAVYRRDDPVWDYFTPPLHYQCRCGTRLLTIRDAARLGVREARQWLESGERPSMPEYRITEVLRKVEPKPGFGQRRGVKVA